MVDPGYRVWAESGRRLTEVEMVDMESKTETKRQGDGEGLEDHAGADWIVILTF